MESHMPLLSLVSLKRSSLILSAFFCTYNDEHKKNYHNLHLIALVIFRHLISVSTHPDFDDLTVETVQHNYNITSICWRISSIMTEIKRKTVRNHSHLWRVKSNYYKTAMDLQLMLDLETDMKLSKQQ